jgi:antitoxin component YwqK of YwqJK toxin-antitoxin module
MNQYNADGEPHGPWEYYYNNGQLRCRQIWLNGKRNGSLETYHSNGQLELKGSFINDNEIGFWCDFYKTEFYL